MKLSKAYEPMQYEQDIYDLWEKSGAFQVKPAKPEDSFSAVMPPPNANGNLHLGHALDIALKDTIIRHQRMKGKQALFLPGADHAGFETWVVFEKKLASEGKSRFDYTREQLYDLVWDFVAENRDNLTNQFRRLGASVDWSKFTFSLDEKVVKTAYATFKKLWDDGLVYRGERLVNFCTEHGTAFSDIEVEYQTLKGKIWEISYPVNNEEISLTVATTRPETMLGDTAIAVNPQDKRYKSFVGKTVRVPLTNRDIPIIADEMVDMEFGTGAVKITPAHDPNDFEVAERHDLPKITVINHEGLITSDAPEEFIGLKVDEARREVLLALKKAGNLVSEKDHENSVGHCYKCKTIIQPLIRDQWFIRMTKLTKPAIDSLKSSDIDFMPEAKLGQVIKYLENIKDWNISRQIAWGIPIPAFQNEDNPDDWIFDDRVSEESIVVGNKTYRRDPDVFDTWFSSGQWPFATLGYPDSPDFKQFYPNSIMETGTDLLQQWVSRMIVLGNFVTKQSPFKTVYFHGMILDPHGAKMSKSKGNVVNPINVADKYGVDALRMGLLTGTSPGNNQPYEESKVIGARNFCNKLWNIARYSEGLIGEEFSREIQASPSSLADHWILSKLQLAANNIDQLLTDYRVGEAYNVLYHFVWDEFADWYLEATKSQPNHSVLVRVLTDSLKLAQPFAPFVSETIWQTLGISEDNLIESSWPTKLARFDAKKAEGFVEIMNIVSEIRYISTAVGIKKPSLYFTKNDFLSENTELITKLAGLGHCKEVEAGRGMHLTQTKLNCWLDIDLESARGYQNKLADQKKAKLASIERLNARLSSDSYISKAPKNIVEQTKNQLRDEQAQLAKIETELKSFTSYSVN